MGPVWEGQSLCGLVRPFMFNLGQKVLAHVLVAAVCAPAGYFAREAYETNIDRPTEMVDIFRTYCVPFASGETIEPGNPFISLPSVDEKAWAHPRSRLILTFDERSCRVSDMLDHMGTEERQALRGTAIALVEAEFPMLERNKKLGPITPGGELVSWTQYSNFDPRRWGVSLHRIGSSGNLSWTSLSVSLPYAGKPVSR